MKSAEKNRRTGTRGTDRDDGIEASREGTGKGQDNRPRPRVSRSETKKKRKKREKFEEGQPTQRGIRLRMKGERTWWQAGGNPQRARVTRRSTARSRKEKKGKRLGRSLRMHPQPESTTLSILPTKRLTSLTNEEVVVESKPGWK